MREAVIAEGYNREYRMNIWAEKNGYKVSRGDEGGVAGPDRDVFSRWDTPHRPSTQERMRWGRDQKRRDDSVHGRMDTDRWSAPASQSPA